MEQEHQLKSLLTEQQFEDAENKEFMLAQARACANGYALATEGIAVVSDFQNNECHIFWQIRSNYNGLPGIYG